VTRFNRALLTERWGVPDEKVEVVRVSVDRKLFTPGPRFVVLMVGSVGYIKGQETLFEAVSILDDPAVEVWVVGGPAGAHPADPETLARKYGVEEQSVFFGWLPERSVAALMRRADVLCAPSREDPSGNLEGFPTVLAEAMVVGLPVITTHHSEIPSVVPAQVIGEDSPRELADALRRYMDAPDIRASDAKANRDVAEHLFAGDNQRRLADILIDAAAGGERGL
jgi:colanic acid/amylovoran biosynthesis glycosyltransferase